MAIKAPIELYRRSIPEGLKTKDLFFVALQDKLTVIKPKELNKNGIKIVAMLMLNRVTLPAFKKIVFILAKAMIGYLLMSTTKMVSKL